MNINIMNEASVKYKENNNNSSMNYQIEDYKYRYYYSVDEKIGKCPSKATEYSKRNKNHI